MLQGTAKKKILKKLVFNLFEKCRKMDYSISDIGIAG